MDFGDLASTAAHDTASAIAMTAHPSSRMSSVCSGGRVSTCNDSRGATPESCSRSEDTYPDNREPVPSEPQGGNHSHETGFDCELGDNLHLTNAESQKGAYFMDT